MFIGSFWMPFSPRWLISVGRYDEARRVLQRMHRSSNEDQEDHGHPPFYLREFHQICAQIELDKEERLGLSAILRKPSYRRRLFLVTFGALFQQLTGVIPIQNYQVIIMEKLGFQPVMTLIVAGVWGTQATLSAVWTGLLYDKLGRRMIMVCISSVALPVRKILPGD